MQRIKWISLGIVSLLVVVFFNYALPSRDIVQIVGTDVKRVDISGGSSQDVGANANQTHDVRFINTVSQSGKTHVYRNEDTSWGWPPYFKFDSGDLNAEAQAFAKLDGAWVAVTHYGWRVKIFSVFPNATKIKPVDGPDVTLIPWFNIVFLTIVAVLALLVFLKIRKLKRRHVDPVLEDVGEAWDSVEDTAADASDSAVGFGGRIVATVKGWFR